MKDKRNVLITTLAVLIGVGLPAVSFAAAVSVECAYTNEDPPGTLGDVECHIYVDTQSAGLISGGVKLLYDTTQLDTPTVTKNITDWYFGAGTSEHSYMNPEIIESPPQGEVTFIVGKLDTDDNPQVGVNSARVLVGTATFARKTADILSGFEDVALGISWTLGRTTGSYVNFVDTSGGDLDGTVTTNTPVVVERGDANGSGGISTADYIATRNLIGSTDFPPYADCNGSGSVTTADFICIRNKI